MEPARSPDGFNVPPGSQPGNKDSHAGDSVPRPTVDTGSSGRAQQLRWRDDEAGGADGTGPASSRDGAGAHTSTTPGDAAAADAHTSDAVGAGGGRMPVGELRLPPHKEVDDEEAQEVLAQVQYVLGLMLNPPPSDPDAWVGAAEAAQLPDDMLELLRRCVAGWVCVTVRV